MILYKANRPCFKNTPSGAVHTKPNHSGTQVAGLDQIHAPLRLNQQTGTSASSTKNVKLRKRERLSNSDVMVVAYGDTRDTMDWHWLSRLGCSCRTEKLKET